MLGRTEHKALLTIYLAIGLSIALPTILFQVMLMPNLILISLKYSLVVLFIANFAISINWQRMPLLHPYLMFLSSIGVLFISRIFLDITNLHDISTSLLYPGHRFEDKTIFRTLIVLYLVLYGAQIGAVMVQNQTSEYHRFPEKPSWKIIGLIFFYIGLPFFAFSHLMVGLEVMERGEAAKVLGDIDFQSNTLTSIMSYLYYAGFIIYLASFPLKKRFYIHLAVFVILLFPVLMEQDFRFVISILLMLASYTYIRNRRLKPIFVITPLIFLLVSIGFFQFITKAPSEGNIKDKAVSEVLNISMPFESLAFSVAFKDQVTYNKSSVFDEIKYEYTRLVSLVSNDTIPVAPQDVNKSYNIYSHNLQKAVNPTYVSHGKTCFATAISEVFQIGGYVAILIYGLLLAIFLVLGLDFLLRKRWRFLILMLLLPTMIIIPNSLFSFIVLNMKYFIAIPIILLLIFVLPKKLRVAAL